jgi:hypothetical protein
MENDILVTMQEDLQRALKKPAKDVRWAMLINARKCVGCHSCTAGARRTPPRVFADSFSWGRHLPNVRPSFPALHAPAFRALVAPLPKEGDGKHGGFQHRVIDYEQCAVAANVPCTLQARSMDGEARGRPIDPGYEKRPSDEYGEVAARGVQLLSRCEEVICLESGGCPTCVSLICRELFAGRTISDSMKKDQPVGRSEGNGRQADVADVRRPTQPRVYHIL